MQKFDFIIKPKQTNNEYFKDIIKYRDLLFILTWRDIIVRYKQTSLGIIWAIIKPLATMMIFTFVFGKIAKFPSESDAPYAIMVFSALLPWQFFSNGFSSCANSLVSSSGMLSKIYFPRLILPISAIVTALVDFIISFLILMILMIYYGFEPSVNILFLPIFIVFVFFTVFSSGILIAALNVEYRDFKHIVPFIVQFGLYISPVGFSSNLIPENYQFIYSLNPMVGIIDGFRWCILGTDTLDIMSICTSLIIMIFLFLFSLNKFRVLERTFADKI